jgi:hypothetical protein
MRGYWHISILTLVLLAFVFYLGIQTEATVWTNLWRRVMKNTLPNPASPVAGTLVQP